MLLFRKRQDVAVRTFILKLVNNNCDDVKALAEGPRADSRVEMVMPVRIIPVENKQPRRDQAFNAVTKEFSNTGVAVVLGQPCGLDEVILGFRLGGDMTFVRAQARHLNPIGGGFYQLGFRLSEIVSAGDCPDLASQRL